MVEHALSDTLCVYHIGNDELAIAGSTYSQSACQECIATTLLTTQHKSECLGLIATELL